MVRDRLADLRRKASPENDLDESGFVREGNPQMKQFFAQVNEIKVLINKITANTEQMNQLYTQALEATRNADVAARTSEIDRLINDSNKTAIGVRRRLQDMGNANKDVETADKQSPGYKGPSAEVRTRNHQHNALTKLFVDAMAQYQQMQSTNQNKFRQRTAREYKIVDPNATPEQVEAVLDAGPGPIFSEQIERVSQSQQNADAQQLLRSIQNRHQDLVKLEESLRELRQLFLDMQQLVEAQGEVLNEIETAVDSAVEYTAKGLEEMKKSVKYQKKARKKMFILLCCVICLIAVIALPLGIVLGR